MLISFSGLGDDFDLFTKLKKPIAYKSNAGPIIKMLNEATAKLAPPPSIVEANIRAERYSMHNIFPINTRVFVPALGFIRISIWVTLKPTYNKIVGSQ